MQSTRIQAYSLALDTGKAGPYCVAFTLRIPPVVAGQKATAVALKVSPSFLNDVLKGRRALTDNLARAMGYEPQEATYTRTATKQKEGGAQ